MRTEENTDVSLLRRMYYRKWINANSAEIRRTVLGNSKVRML